MTKTPHFPENTRPLTRALISVYDKTGLEQLAQGLSQAGVEIISTGSTAKKIAQSGVDVTEVSDITGFPECLDGRVKTLHPCVHAGILADQRKESHKQQLKDLDIAAFDLVIVNLYPFQDTVNSGADFDECVEQIDIGGPTMVRAAAKNHPSVAVVVDPSHYDEVVAAAQGDGFTQMQRARLAQEAFQHTAHYDTAVANWFNYQLDLADKAEESDDHVFPGWYGQDFALEHTLRYGENPHQAAALYVDSDSTGGLAGAEQLHGKEMSYNNYVDSDAAWRSAHDFEDPAVAIIKHANPCGIAVSQTTIAEAYSAAHACDSVSAYGGVIAANREVTAQMAQRVAEVFTEVIIAPSYEAEALKILTAKKNLRILQIKDYAPASMDQRQISGGMLLQKRDFIDAAGDDPTTWTLATGEAVDEKTLADLAFAWSAVRAVKSNAIVLAKDQATVGVGMGQVNRVDSAHLAVDRAGAERAQGSVAASDAFFPFADGLEVLLDAGVKAVVQPGGSIRDQEVIDAANKAGVTMYFTGERHFSH